MISHVFLSQKQSLSFKSNLSQLNKLIEDRPLYVRNVINQIFNEQFSATLKVESDQASFDDYPTIKSASPFTKHF